MVNHCLATNGKSYGYDISATACEKAASIFPNSCFSVLDLRQRTTNNEKTNNEQPARLFMMRATLWYVFQELATVVENIANRMQYSDRLLVVQNFPPLHSMFIGKDILPDHFALLEQFSSHFAAYKHIWYEDSSKAVNDNWFIGLFTLKDQN